MTRFNRLQSCEAKSLTVWGYRWLLAAATLLISLQALGQGSHAHGQAELYLAFNNKRELAVEFKAPNADIFGFETLGQNKARLETLKKQRAVLKNLEGLLKVSGLDSCQYRAQSLKAFDRDLLKETNANKKTKDHQHSHQHEEKKSDDKHHDKHSHDHHHGDHSDFNGSYLVTCKQSIAGQSLELRFGEVFPAIKRLSVVLIGETSQNKWDVRQARYKITL